MKKNKTAGRLSTLFLALALMLSLPVMTRAEDFTATVGVEELLSFGLEYHEDSTYTLVTGVPGMTLGQSQGIMVLQGTPTTAGSYKAILTEVTVDAVERSASFTLLVTAPGESEPQESTPEADGPKITKHPTDERVVEGESAIFIARAEDTQQYVWELLTAEGGTVLCSDLSGHVAGIRVTGHDTQTLTLSNIPLELDGCKVRCRFVGAGGSSFSEYAAITVIAGDAKPEVTKDPTGERVREGGMCQFVARADNAIGYTWMIMSDTGTARYECVTLPDIFPDMRVEGAEGECLTLYSVSAELDGWSVYCVFTGPGGDVNSKSAMLSVTPLPTEPTETQPPTTEAPTTEATQPPTTETTAPPSTEAPTQPVQPAETEPPGTPEPSKGSGMSRGGFVLIFAAIVGLTVVGVAGIAAFVVLRLKERRDEDYEYDDEDE